MGGETTIFTEVIGDKLQENEKNIRRLSHVCYSSMPGERERKTLEASQVTKLKQIAAANAVCCSPLWRDGPGTERGNSHNSVHVYQQRYLSGSIVRIISVNVTVQWGRISNRRRKKLAFPPLPLKELKTCVSLLTGAVWEALGFSHTDSRWTCTAFESIAKSFTTFKTVAFVCLLHFNTENIPLQWEFYKSFCWK